MLLGKSEYISNTRVQRSIKLKINLRWCSQGTSLFLKETKNWFLFVFLLWHFRLVILLLLLDTLLSGCWLRLGKKKCLIFLLEVSSLELLFKNGGCLIVEVGESDFPQGDKAGVSHSLYEILNTPEEGLGTERLRESEDSRGDGGDRYGLTFQLTGPDQSRSNTRSKEANIISPSLKDTYVKDGIMGMLLH